MRRAWMLAIILFGPISAMAVVDMRSANFSDTWLDMEAAGSGYELKIQRVYNSRTLFNGIFGFGWCSDYETRLEITAEGTLKLIECGGGQEIDYMPEGFKSGKVSVTIGTIMKEVKKRNKDLDKKYLKKLEKDLRTDTFLREEFARQLDIKGKIKKGVSYFASGRQNEMIVLKGTSYVRTLPDGTYQKFDKVGRLVRLYDRNQNALDMKYKKGKLVEVIDNKGRKLSFKYSGAAGKIKQITGPGGLKATYSFKGEELREMKNAWKSTYKYRYDDLHNLIRIDYPDKTHKSLTYNKDRDWVTSFRDRKGCVETYKYVGADKKVLTKYKSSVVKNCKGKVTNTSSYEFHNKVDKKTGQRYLAKAVSTINGKKSEIVYHPKFGKPTAVFAGGARTSYDYYKNGFLKSKKDVAKEMDYKYKNNCRKVSRVKARYFEWRKPSKAKSRKRKLSRSVSTDFNYDKKCNLKYAKNSLGQTVSLTYDPLGRIASIRDQAKKLVKIKYDVRFGKPSMVTRPGLGTITVKYKKSGEISKIDSKEGPAVAVQVASIFNNLLDIIAPATSEMQL